MAVSVHAQVNNTAAAPAKELFSPGGDQVGLFQNSVNLFTGEVAFTLPLVSIPGRGGMTAGIALSYNSSGVRQQARTWNMTSPTSIAGLGWQLDVPKIVVDHKQTGTRHDDEFYWVENGISNKLILFKKENGVRYYKTKNYQYGEISYQDNIERWVINRDGIAYIYGDKASGRSTVQYLVNWGNWIGNSTVTTGQSQYAMQWDLSEIYNQWGDAVTFTYRQINQQVGQSGAEHTEASYLTKITNPQGQTIELQYEDKISDGNEAGGYEYQEPHTEEPEPDAYQERYEKEYLKTVRVLDNSQSERYRVDLSYMTMGSGNFYKRLLSGIQKVVDNSHKLPPVEFAYHLSGEKAGLLEIVTTSQGPQVSYTYTPMTVAGSELDSTLTAPPGYGEPQTWIGNDYVVVAWRELRSDGNHEGGPRNVKVTVYQWDGRWIKGEEEEIPNIALAFYRYQYFEVVTGPDFFGVLYYNVSAADWYVKLFHQNENQVGQWSVATRSVKGNRGTLHAGNNFVALATAQPKNSESSQLKVFDWNGSSWQETMLHDQPGDYYYTAANNYIVAQNNDPNPDEVRLYYQDEMKQWRNKVLPANQSYQTGEYDCGFLGANCPSYEAVSSFWYAGNSSAVWMADANEEAIMQWDQDYNLTLKKGILGGWYDLAPVLVTNEMVSVMQVSSGSVPIAAYRYDGQTWHTSSRVNSFSNGQGTTSSLGSDFLAFPRVPDGDSAQVRYFDPNSLTWEYRHVFKSSPNIHEQTYAGTNYVVFGDQYYYRKPNGSWELVYTIPAYDGWNQAYFFSGGYQLTTVNSGLHTYVNNFDNGQVEVHTLYNQSLFRGFNQTVGVTGSLINSNIVVTFPNSVSAMEDAREITLHKLIDRKLTGKPVIYPVTLVNVHDGYVRQPTSYSYTNSSASLTASGISGQFNEVQITPGTETASVTPYGYAKHYFINGRTDNELSISTNVAGFTNAKDFTEKLLGVTYATRTYNNQDTLVAESNSQWKVFASDIEAIRTDDTVKIAQSNFARITFSIQQQDDVSRSTTSLYNNYGQVVEVSGSDSEGNFRRTSYRYAGDFADNEYTFGSKLLRDRNIFGPVLEQVEEVNSTVIRKSESHYALQHGQPVPGQTIVYPTGGSESLTTNLSYDAYGNLVQSQTEGGLVSAFLYGYQYTFPIAEAAGATYNALKGEVDLVGLQDMDEDDLRDELDLARTGLPDALIVSRTFDEFYGTTSETDSRGRMTQTYYDNLGRLQYVKDENGFVRQKLEYSATR